MGSERGSPDINDVAEANESFYKAFSGLDIVAMETVWETSECITCIHPGWLPLFGWPSIRGSWESIFQNANLMHFTITDSKIRIDGNCGWVTCLETITSVVDGRADQYSVWATNIFARSNSRWRMVYHHAS